MAKWLGSHQWNVHRGNVCSFYITSLNGNHCPLLLSFPLPEDWNINVAIKYKHQNYRCGQHPSQKRGNMIKVTGFLADLVSQSHLPTPSLWNIQWQRNKLVSYLSLYRLGFPCYSSMVSSQVIGDPCHYPPKLGICLETKEMWEELWIKGIRMW